MKTELLTPGPFEYHRRDRDEMEQSLLRQVLTQFIVQPHRNLRCVLPSWEAENLRLADMRLPRYRELIASHDLCIQLGRNNDNLVALTSFDVGLVDSLVAASPLLQNTMRLHWSDRTSLLFRLDTLTVNGASGPDWDLSMGGNIPILVRRLRGPRLTGVPPVLVAAEDVAWDALGPSSRELFAEPEEPTPREIVTGNNQPLAGHPL